MASVFRKTQSALMLFFMALPGFAYTVNETHPVQDNSADISEYDIVRGVVKDTKGSTIPGDTAVVLGTKTVAMTDNNGYFELRSVAYNAEIEFSCLGMLTDRKRVVSPVLDIVMKDDVIGLESVIVTGYTSLKRKELTGSISSISSEDVVRIPSNSISESLVGVAGIRMDGGNIRIRWCNIDYYKASKKGRNYGFI